MVCSLSGERSAQISSRNLRSVKFATSAKEVTPAASRRASPSLGMLSANEAMVAAWCPPRRADQTLSSLYGGPGSERPS
eukprot:7991464-Heterocapsa_arctica.AAC.1